jgi:hypothetical protein
MKKETFYPVDIKGNLLYYYDGYEKDVTLVKNEVKYRTIKITGLERHRSTSHFKCIDIATKQQFTLFMVDLMAIISTGAIIKGEVSGDFEYCKRGSNYGIHLAKMG